jgi:hypothetical protein
LHEFRCETILTRDWLLFSQDALLSLHPPKEQKEPSSSRSQTLGYDMSIGLHLLVRLPIDEVQKEGHSLEI